MLCNGPGDSPVGIFIFKKDKKNQVAWDDSTELPHTRVELHTQRQPFLAALSAWESRVGNIENSCLLIYAHGHMRGISPTDPPAGEFVSWYDLALALPRRVATLWLVGCNSQDVKNAWPTPSASPVRSSLLVTTSTIDWQPLIKYFRSETDIDQFVVFNDMKSYLLRAAGDDGQQVEYLDARGAGWVPFQQTPDPIPMRLMSLEVLESIWPIR